MTQKAILLLLTITAALVLAGGASLAAVPNSGADKGTQKASPPRATKDPDAALDKALKKLVAMPGGPPGAIAVVQRDDEPEVHAFGVADVSTGEPMEVEDHMRIASAAKAFSGAVALSLVSKKELSLDDTIGEHLPELPDAWHEVTLRQLLQHTSGLPDFSNDQGFREALLDSLTVAPPPEELLSFVDDEPLEFEPGSEYQYSNSDNIAVALMVEAATESTYEEQLQEQVYGPLGLTNTSLPSGPDLEVPYIHGYDNDFSPPQEQPEDLSELVAAGWAWASGGIVSTPADLNAFVRGYVDGQLFDEEEEQQQRLVVQGGSSEPPGPGKNSAGLGIFRYDTRCGTVWGHTGNTPGYTQFMAASPDGSRSVTVSINTQLTQNDGLRGAFNALRRAEEYAVCAALAGS